MHVRTAIYGLLALLPSTLLAQGHSHPAHPAPAAPRMDSASAATTGEKTGVVATVQALFAAAERADMAALDTLYAGDSLTVVEGAGINRGWADYRDRHLGPELQHMRNFRYRPFEIEAHVRGDVAWAMFRYALQADAGTQAVDVVGRGTAILERRGGRWIVRHTQTSSRPRRPNDPPMPSQGAGR